MVTVEVVDSTRGRPAVGVSVTLRRASGGRWDDLAATRTDGASQISFAMPPGSGRGRYGLLVDLDAYFGSFGMTPFQSQAEFIVRIRHDRDHIRLLLIATSSSCCIQLVRSDGAEES